MRNTYKLDDGTKLVSASQRRYVTFNVTDDSQVHVVKRTDNYLTADQNHTAAMRRGYCRVVTVDFTENRVFADSANNWRR